MSTTVWYVKADRTRVDFNTAVVNGITQFPIYRLEVSDKYPGHVLESLWAPAQYAVDDNRLAAAIAEADVNTTIPPPDSPEVPPTPDDPVADETARATAAEGAEVTRATAAEGGLRTLSDATFLAGLKGQFSPRVVPSPMAGSGFWVPEHSVYNMSGSAFRKTRAALGRAYSGLGMCEILCLGASLTEGYPGQPSTSSYPAYLIQMLAARGFPAAPGFVMPQMSKSASTDDSRWVFNGFTKFTTYKNPGMQGTSTGSAETFTSTNKGAILEWIETGVSGAHTFTIDGNVNAFSYNINGGTSTPVTAGAAAVVVASQGAANSSRTFQVTGLDPNSTHTLTITTTTNTGVYVGKARVRNATGLYVTNAGFGGSMMSEWDTTMLGAPINSYYALQPTAYNGFATVPQLCIFDTINWVNDYNNSSGAFTAANFRDSLQRIVGQLQARGSEVLLLNTGLPSATVGNGSYPAYPDSVSQAYRQMIYTVSDLTGVPLIDAVDRHGDWATANANSLTTDSYHLKPEGYAGIARGVDALLAA